MTVWIYVGQRSQEGRTRQTLALLIDDSIKYANLSVEGDEKFWYREGLECGRKLKSLGRQDYFIKNNMFLPSIFPKRSDDCFEDGEKIQDYLISSLRNGIKFILTKE